MMGEINVVPYIDVMLVLLVIFMVTAPMLSQGVKVDLPQADSQPIPQDDREPAHSRTSDLIPSSVIPDSLDRFAISADLENNVVKKILITQFFRLLSVITMVLQTIDPDKH